MSNQISQTAEVPYEMGNKRLDQVAAQLFPEYSRSRLQQWIKDGQLQVNGKTIRGRDKLVGGETLTLEAELTAEGDWQAEDIPLDIIYEDDDILVVNKQAGLVVHPAAGNYEGTMLNGLLHHCPQLENIPRAGIVHRLDKDTTGCIVIAKSQEALVRLQVQIQKRIASRDYLAVVHGVPAGDSGTIVGAIGRHPADRKKYAVVSDENGRYACTHWSLQERLGDYSLLRFKLDTGRTHQIRVHCSHMNHPVVGDPTYSRCRKLPIDLPGQALHAFQLGLDHPINRERMVFEAPMPPVMEKLLGVLRRRNASGQC
mgnify:CR=1 FL=1